MKFRIGAVSLSTAVLAALSLGVSTAAAQDADDPAVVHERCYEQSTVYPIASALLQAEMPPDFRPAPFPAEGSPTTALAALASDCKAPGRRVARTLYYGVVVDPPPDLELTNQGHVLLFQGYTDDARFVRHAKRWCFGHVLEPGIVEMNVTSLPGARVGTARGGNQGGSIAFETSVPDPGTVSESPPDRHTVRFFAARDGVLVGVMDMVATPAVVVGPGAATLLMDRAPSGLSQPPASSGAALHIFPGPEPHQTHSFAFSSPTHCAPNE